MTQREQWLEIATILAKDPSEKLKCPRCQHYILTVRDVDVDAKHIERWIECPECKAKEAMLMPRGNES
jgi:hypothetical protein